MIKNQGLKNNQNKQNSIKIRQSYSNKIGIKSIDIIKPELELNINRKLTISIVLTELNDELRKLVRYVSSKYAMNLYNEWEIYYNKQKQQIKRQKQKGNQLSIGQNQLIICDQSCLGKLLRQMKINPTLRVILFVNDVNLFQLKQDHSFLLITHDWVQIQNYLTQIRKRLILTSKN